MIAPYVKEVGTVYDSLVAVNCMADVPETERSIIVLGCKRGVVFATIIEIRAINIRNLRRSGEINSRIGTLFSSAQEGLQHLGDENRPPAVVPAQNGSNTTGTCCSLSRQCQRCVAPVRA